jgi:hypothetical protein
MHQPNHIRHGLRTHGNILPGVSRRVIGVGLALLIGVAGLSGCTSEEPKPTPTPTATEQTEAGITEITDTPGSGEELVGALADTQVTTCELADGQWNVAGTATNSSDAPATYRIYVSLLTAGGDTRSLTQVNVDPLDPGAEAEWSTTVALDEEDLNCVLRVERYAVAAEQPAPEETTDSEGEG